MKRILGVEGGGTKTDWLCLDETGGVVGNGRLPSANLRLISDRELDWLLRVLPADMTKVGVFLAGCATEADRLRLHECVARVWPGAGIAIGSDRESGFASAFQGRDGVAVISGTGSAITGRAGNRFEYAGGWGQFLGDKGSGYDLAVQALRHVLWSYDLTREMTPTAAAILSALALNQLADLVSWAKDSDKMSVARLAPVVFDMAAHGDPEMSAILDGGARALAEGACAVAGRLGMDHPEIKLQGGLFQNRPEYAERFIAHLAPMMPTAAVSVCNESGAVGAAWLAARQADGVVSSATQKPGEKPEIDIAELTSALTEQVNPRSLGLDGMSTAKIVDLFIDEEARIGEALAGAKVPLIAAIELTSDAFRQGGRLFYVGAGTSGRLGMLDASEIPPTFGTEPALVQAIMAGGVAALHQSVEGAEDQAEAGALAVVGRGVSQGDVVCGIAASGRTPFVLGALQRARGLGARTILISCNPARRHSGLPWDVEIDLAAGPELLTGSTRLKAGTVTKCALNILSTASMVRLGKVHGNLMAGVVASNAKLRDRAVRLVSMIRGLSLDEAKALLEEQAWEVKKCV